MCNIFRGRCQEGYGEDTMLMSEMAAAYVPNLQFDDTKTTPYYQALATCKHFDLQNGPEKHRMEFDAITNYRDWMESFQHHFKTCAENNAASFMCSYNGINGIPACANKELLIDILRGKWNFTGFVTSDCGAIPNLYNYQHYVKNKNEASEAAIKSGCDWYGNCNGPVSMPETLFYCINNETLPEYYLDNALRRVLPFLFKLGVIDEPYGGMSFEINPFIEAVFVKLCRSVV